MLRLSLTDDAPSSDTEVLRALFQGKWRLRIVQVLLLHPLRLSELRRSVPECSKKVLIDTLQDLEALGVVEREDLSSKVRRVEYRIHSAHIDRLREVLKHLE